MTDGSTRKGKNLSFYHIDKSLSSHSWEHVGTRAGPGSTCLAVRMNTGQLVLTNSGPPVSLATARPGRRRLRAGGSFRPTACSPGPSRSPGAGHLVRRRLAEPVTTVSMVLTRRPVPPASTMLSMRLPPLSGQRPLSAIKTKPHGIRRGAFCISRPNPLPHAIRMPPADLGGCDTLASKRQHVLWLIRRSRPGGTAAPNGWRHRSGLDRRPGRLPQILGKRQRILGGGSLKPLPHRQFGRPEDEGVEAST